MAYRFMLEVPEYERKEAEITVGSNPETQIVTSRASYPHGYDIPYRSLTISSESLRVVESIYAWFASAQNPLDSSLVLFSGERIPLGSSNSSQAIAAIRGDQAWVEHAIPRIGDHVREEFVDRDIVADLKSAVATEAAAEILNPAVAVAPDRKVAIEAFNYVAINVGDLQKAERFYTTVFDMDLIGRTRNLSDGSLEFVGPDYNWETAIVTETEADDTYLRNGPLSLTLHRVGVGARMTNSILARVSIRVDGATFGRLRSQALMRSMEMHQVEDNRIVFRDPFGVVWEISVAGLLPEILMNSVSGAF